MEPLDRTLTSRKRMLWNEAAEANPYYYIASTQTHWNVEEFFASGEQETRQLVEPFFQRMNFHRGDKRMLDIGCGVGRMTRAFSFVFGEAHGVDISEKMVAQGQKLNSDRPNLHMAVNDGTTLRGYPDNYFDFVFSFVTFQHIPSTGIVASYLQEMGRVLKPGGLFKFQVNGTRWSYALGVPIPVWLKNPLVQISLVGPMSTFVHGHPGLLGRFAFAGVSLPEGRLTRLLRAAGLGSRVWLQGVGTREMWCEGVRV